MNPIWAVAASLGYLLHGGDGAALGLLLASGLTLILQLSKR